MQLKFFSLLSIFSGSLAETDEDAGMLQATVKLRDVATGEASNQMASAAMMSKLKATRKGVECLARVDADQLKAYSSLLAIGADTIDKVNNALGESKSMGAAVKIFEHLVTKLVAESQQLEQLSNLGPAAHQTIFKSVVPDFASDQAEIQVARSLMRDSCDSLGVLKMTGVCATIWPQSDRKKWEDTFWEEMEDSAFDDALVPLALFEEHQWSFIEEQALTVGEVLSLQRQLDDETNALSHLDDRFSKIESTLGERWLLVKQVLTYFLSNGAADALDSSFAAMKGHLCGEVDR